MEEKKYKVTYKIELFTKNGSIRPDGFNSIEFIRKGDENIIVAQSIELDSDTPSFVFINRPDEIINTNFDFKFDGAGTNPKLIVVKTYCERIQ
ncbi:hypothetical protein ES708_20422 [subsurface metagenome]